MPETETSCGFRAVGTAATADMAASWRWRHATSSRMTSRWRSGVSPRRQELRLPHAHPEDHRADQTGFSTGGITCRMSTGACGRPRRCGEALAIQRTWWISKTCPALQQKVDLACSWGHVKNWRCTATWRPSGRARSALVDEVQSALLRAADQIVQIRDQHGYAGRWAPSISGAATAT